MRSRELTLALATIGFLITFYLVSNGITTQPDDEFLRSLNAFAANAIVGVLSSAITQFGSEVILAVIAVLYYFLDTKQNTQMLVGILFVVAISDLVLSVLKGAYFRPRPYQALPNVLLPIGQDEGSSFPSGHVTRAFATVTFIILRKGGRYVPLLLLSGAVAISRVVLGVHFPSDVVAGAFLGVMLAQLSLIFLNRYVFPRIPGRRLVDRYGLRITLG